MEVYYWTIAVVFVLSFAAEILYVNKQQHAIEQTGQVKSLGTTICLLLVTGVLVFVAGFRFYVGTDYGAYYKGLSIYAPTFWKALKTYDEPGLPLIASIVKWFTYEGKWFIFSCSLITVGLFLRTIFKNTDAFLMATLLFVLIGIWHGTFNGVRQYMASAVLFCGHRYIYEKKFWKWLLIVILAGAFHISAVVMVTLYFLLRNKVNMRNILLLAIGTYIVSANYDTIFSFIGFLKDKEIVETAYNTRSVNTLRILVACAPAVLCLALNFGKDLTDEQTFYTNAMVIHGAAMLAASNSAYLARIGIFTSPYVVVTIPKIVRLKNKYVEFLLRAGIVVLYGVFWYIDVSGSDALNNFRWVFTK